MESISTIPDLIDAFGGSVRLARWAGYEDERGVINWTYRGIPPSYHLRLILEAIRRGLVIDPAVFGIEGDDAAELIEIFIRARGRSPRGSARLIRDVARAGR